MTFPTYFNPKKSSNLFGKSKNFKFLKDLFFKNKLPQTLMLSGKKGSGKFTLITHLMSCIYDEDKYDLNKQELNTETTFYNQFINNIFPNIIYVSGSDYNNIKIDDIRNLKTKIFQSSISNKPRFIIFDDVELFNKNSSNALLKIIEEPTKNNFFLLINNKSKPIIETIKSRCIDFKIILSEKERLVIIESLIKKFNINSVIDPKIRQLTPGYYLIFNYICEVNEISLDNDYIKNLSLILNLYKKNKEVRYIDLILFLTNYYFNNLKNNNLLSNEKIIEYKSFVFENINKFFLYNLNQNALLNSINGKIK
jgi:DNA polymerase-3 subunit delta'